MIRGSVNPDREACVPVEVQDSLGTMLSLQAVVDTGFNGSLTLSNSVIQGLSLRLQGTRDAMLADGSSVRLDIYRAIVSWDGNLRAVQILAAEGGPLVGTALLHGYELRVEFVDGGSVTIEALP